MNNVTKLLDLCHNIAGIKISELAEINSAMIPLELKNNKGWIGQLLEQYLGIEKNNVPLPDFPELGIELKTIPVRLRDLTPTESTFICNVPLKYKSIPWEQSGVKRKLSKILWVPIEINPTVKWVDRRIGKAFIWQPNDQEMTVLHNDWEELTEILQLGKIELLSAKYGKYLQIRPKAVNCKKNLIEYVTIDDKIIQTVPRGFYLRASFTKQIIRAKIK